MNTTKPGDMGVKPVRRRNLPHWEIDGSTYFITFRTRDLELTPEIRRLVLEACRHFEGVRYRLWSAVVMPDHVHLLLTPRRDKKGQWYALSRILHSLKSFSAKQINELLKRRGAVWQDESYDRIMRDEAECLEKWEYIRNNPVKRGLCSRPEEWEGWYECGGPGSSQGMSSQDREGG